LNSYLLFFKITNKLEKMMARYLELNDTLKLN